MQPVGPEQDGTRDTEIPDEADAIGVWLRGEWPRDATVPSPFCGVSRSTIPFRLREDAEPATPRERVADAIERAGGRVCGWALTLADAIRGGR